MSPDEARRAAERLSAALERDDFAGYDPYDALSSPLLRRVARRGDCAARAIQGLKRSPVNLRPLLGVPRRRTRRRSRCSSPRTPAARRTPDRVRERHVRPRRPADARGRLGVRLRRPDALGLLSRRAAERGRHRLRRERAPRCGGSGAERFGRAGGRVGAVALELLRPEGWFAYYPGARYPIHNASLLAGPRSSPARGGQPRTTRSRSPWSISAPTAPGRTARGRGSNGWTATTRRTCSRASTTPERTTRSRAGSTSSSPGSSIRTADRGRRSSRATRWTPTRRRPRSPGSAAWRAATSARSPPRSASSPGRSPRCSATTGTWLPAAPALPELDPYVRWSDAHMLLALATYLEPVPESGPRARARRSSRPPRHGRDGRALRAGDRRAAARPARVRERGEARGDAARRPAAADRRGVRDRDAPTASRSCGPRGCSATRCPSA